MQHLINPVKQPLNPSNRAEWAKLRRCMSTYSHSHGYVLVCTRLTCKPRPGAGGDLPMTPIADSTTYAIFMLNMQFISKDVLLQVVMNPLDFVNARVTKPTGLKVIKPPQPNICFFRNQRHWLFCIFKKLNSFFIKFIHGFNYALSFPSQSSTKVL